MNENLGVGKFSVASASPELCCLGCPGSLGLWAPAAGGQTSAVILRAAPGKTGLVIQGLICTVYRGHPSVSKPGQPSQMDRAHFGDYSILFYFICSIVKMARKQG